MLGDGTNFNDIKTCGFYSLIVQHAESVQNFPSEVYSYGLFVVLSVDDFIVQVFFPDSIASKVMVRNYYTVNDRWTKWRSIGQ